MTPTYIGFIVVVLGMLVFRGPMTWTLLLAIVGTIFGAASAVNLPALGGSSIQPSVFALVFLAARISVSPHLLSGVMERSIKDTLLFGLFAGYALLSAYLFPRMFYHQLELPPTKAITLAIYEVAPLQPTSQNITQSTYLLGTFFVVLATLFIARTERRSRLAAMTLLYLGCAHVFFGVLDLACKMANITVMNVVRNASYAIVNQEYGSFHRIQGTFSEPSSYAIYGLALLVFSTELWLRDIELRLTAFTSAGLTLLLMASTSSSAYFGLAVYGAILGLRIAYLPSKTAQRKGLILASCALLAAVLGMGVYVGVPGFAADFSRMLADMTVNKSQSLSAVQRGFWVSKSWDAFSYTKGLGVGVGSFRSSSLVSSIAGATGVFGLTMFVAFLYKVLPLHRIAADNLDGEDRTAAVGAAAGWAAVVGLAPAMVAGANPDPGVMFAFLAGLALAWAPYGRRAETTQARRPRPAQASVARRTARPVAASDERE